MGRNREKDRLQIEKTRERLLNSGREAILELGLQQVKVRDVVARASLGIGTFYFHFKDLEHFQREVIRQAIDEVRIKIRQIRGLRDKSAMQNPESSIRQSFETFFDLIDQDYRIALILIRERTGSSDLSQLIRQQFDMFISELKEDLQAASEYGLTRSDLPFDLAAEAIIGMNLQLSESYAQRRLAMASSAVHSLDHCKIRAAEDRERVVSVLTHISMRGLLQPLDGS